MNIVVDLVLKYWIIIVIICVLILMALIGYYADSNSLVKQKKEKKKAKVNDLKIKIELDDITEDNDVSEEVVVEPSSNSGMEQTDFEFNEENISSNVENVETNEEVPNTDIVAVETTEDLESNEEEVKEYNLDSEVLAVENDEEEQENFEEFEKYFNQVLPEKPLINNSIDKFVEKLELSSEKPPISDKLITKDIELPEIKEKELETSVWV